MHVYSLEMSHNRDGRHYVILPKRLQLSLPQMPDIEYVLKIVTSLAIGLWIAAPGSMKALLMLMAINYVTFIIACVIRKELSSWAIFQDLGRKALIIGVVSASYVVDTYLNLNIGLMSIVCIFYLINEVIAIVEHMATCGVPIPQALLETMLKTKGLQGRRATKQEIEALTALQEGSVVLSSKVKTVEETTVSFPVEKSQ